MKGYFLYKMLDVDGNTIYVGKTNNLHNRMISHRDSGVAWINDVANIYYTRYSNPITRDMAEIYYINKLNAKHNKQSKDNKHSVDIAFSTLIENDNWQEFFMPKPNPEGFSMIRRYNVSSPSNYKPAVPEYHSKGFNSIFQELMKYVGVDNHVRLPSSRCLAYTDDVAKMLNISQNKLSKFIAASKKIGTIIGIGDSVKRQIYLVNPAYHFIGNSIDKMTVILFRYDDVFANHFCANRLKRYYKRLFAE